MYKLQTLVARGYIEQKKADSPMAETILMDRESARK